MKKRVMVSADYYSPGFKAGGAVRSLANIMGRLGDRLDFSIVTRNHDLGDAEPYPGIEADTWLKQGPLTLYYARRSSALFWKVHRAIRGKRTDVLYLNSFFSPAFTIFPLLMRRLGAGAAPLVVLAPRGELTVGALGMKRAKKRAFLALGKVLGLYRGVRFQASSEMEASDIRREIGSAALVSVAVDLPIPGAQAPPRTRRKKRDALRAVVVTRAARNKNLVGALQILAGMDLPVEFDIFGPIEDRAYWEECRRVIATSLAAVVRHRGPLRPDAVVPALADYDLFFLPSLGENFGHVILEALLAGCPVLLSDRTPWRDLEAEGVGWSFPLGDPSLFRQALESAYRMDGETYQGFVERARAYAQTHLRAEQAELANLNLFGGGTQARNVESMAL